MAANNFYTEKDTRYVFVDGLLCDTTEKLYATLRLQLSLPGYFGNNLDALSDVLGDLEWIPEKKVKLILLHGDLLLQSEPAKKGALLALLKKAASPRLEVISHPPG